jgi:hypothetical protein
MLSQKRVCHYDPDLSGEVISVFELKMKDSRLRDDSL